MKNSALIIIVILSSFGAACATPDSSQTKTQRSGLSTIMLVAASEDGESVDLQLTNGTEQLMGANMCSAKVEVLAGEEWQPRSMDLDKDCEDDHKAIGPGSERSATYRSEAFDFTEEEYRFVINVEYPMGLGFESITSAPVEFIGAEVAEEPADDEVEEGGEEELEEAGSDESESGEEESVVEEEEPAQDEIDEDLE